MQIEDIDGNALRMGKWLDARGEVCGRGVDAKEIELRSSGEQIFGLACLLEQQDVHAFPTQSLIECDKAEAGGLGEGIEKRVAPILGGRAFVFGKCAEAPFEPGGFLDIKHAVIFHPSVVD